MALNRYVDVLINNKDCKAELKEPLVIFEKDKNAHIYFRLVDYRYQYKMTPATEEDWNIIYNLNGADAWITIVKPDGSELEQGKEGATVNNVILRGEYVRFNVSPDLTDEMSEIGIYKLQIHITDKEGGEVTIPSFSFEVKERLKGIAVTEGIMLLAEEGDNLLTENGIELYAAGAGKKISDLTTRNTCSGTEYLPVAFGGATYKMPTSLLKGKDGVVPTIKIGIVNTLPPGSSATVTATTSNNVITLDFGIPRGADGSGSGGSEDGHTHTNKLELDKFATGDKAKLDTASTHAGSAHAPVNAEQNVQADWNVTDTVSDAYIKNKPAIPPATQVVDNLTSTDTNKALSANQGKILDGKVAENTSQIADITQSLPLNYEPKIATKGTAFNKNFGSGSGQVAEGNHGHSKSNISDFPTKLSEFENDIGAGGGTNTDIPSDLSLNGNILKLKKSDGSTIGLGVTLPSGGGQSSSSLNYYNVKDYGAIGDGVTDDTTAIQSVLDFAKTNGSVKVYIPSGVYVIKRLILNSNTDILMDKDTILKRNRTATTAETNPLFLNGTKGDKTVGGYDGNSNISIQGGTIDGNWVVGDESGVAYGLTFAFGHCKNISLKDITIIDGGNGDHVIDFSGVKGIYIARCNFLGVHGVGRYTEMIQLDYASDGSFPHFGKNDHTPTHNVIIEQCLFKPNPQNSDSICNICIGSHSAWHPNPSENIIIRDNTIIDSLLAFNIVHSKNVLIYNNKIDYTKDTTATNVITVTTMTTTNEFYEKTDCINIEKNIITNFSGVNVKSVVYIYTSENDSTRFLNNIRVKDNTFKNILTSRTIANDNDKIYCLYLKTIKNITIEGNVFENINGMAINFFNEVDNVKVIDNYLDTATNFIAYNSTSGGAGVVNNLKVTNNKAINITDSCLKFEITTGNKSYNNILIDNLTTDAITLILGSKFKDLKIINCNSPLSSISISSSEKINILNNSLASFGSSICNEFNPLKSVNICNNTFNSIGLFWFIHNGNISENIILNNTAEILMNGCKNVNFDKNKILAKFTSNNVSNVITVSRADVTGNIFMTNNTFEIADTNLPKYFIKGLATVYCFNNNYLQSSGTSYTIGTREGFITVNANKRYFTAINMDNTITNTEIV